MCRRPGPRGPPLGLGLSEGLGGAGGRGSISLPRDDLANAYEIAIGVNDRELSKTPRLVFKSVHTGDARPRQVARRTRAIEALDVQNSDVATS